MLLFQQTSSAAGMCLPVEARHIADPRFLNAWRMETKCELQVALNWHFLSLSCQDRRAGVLRATLLHFQDTFTCWGAQVNELLIFLWLPVCPSLYLCVWRVSVCTVLGQFSSFSVTVIVRGLLLWHSGLISCRFARLHLVGSGGSDSGGGAAAVIIASHARSLIA